MYKLQAILTTSAGELQVDCRTAEDGWIDGTFTDSTGTWKKYFADKSEVRYYLHNRLHVKNVIRLMEVF